MRSPLPQYHKNIAEDGSRSASLLNRCNLSPRFIASEEFQENPQPIEIEGVRELDRWLFRRLAQMDDPEERIGFFHDYVCVKFGLTEGTAGYFLNRSLEAPCSYTHFLRSWGVDSNGNAGAVLKAWVESRFGLLATYHSGCLATDEKARAAFLMDRMKGSAQSIGVLMQLDLLYAFCQDELRRRFPGERWMTLYRGTHDPEEYAVRNRTVCQIEKGKHKMLVQLNNLSSFTSDPEIAWEFGCNIWETRVPFSKIVFFNGLAPKFFLASESEFLVLGGFYNVFTRLV
jgi:NAD+--dinitrogen-reductase ADP-D-ribosyltransferase